MVDQATHHAGCAIREGLDTVCTCCADSTPDDIRGAPSLARAMAWLPAQGFRSVSGAPRASELSAALREMARRGIAVREQVLPGVWAWRRK